MKRKPLEGSKRVKEEEETLKPRETTNFIRNLNVSHIINNFDPDNIRLADGLKVGSGI